MVTLACFVGPLRAAASDEPLLTEAMIEHIKTLPYGLSLPNSVLIRSKHVDQVIFYGAGRPSRKGFVKKQGLVKDALWLEFRNRGEETWASGSIKFKEPFDVTGYNSVVVWVRANLARFRMSVGIQDPGWSQTTVAQARTEPMPVAGFPRNEVIQVAIPLRKFEADKPLNKKKISHMVFEFGTETTGNQKIGSLEIFGIAFVLQEPALKNTQQISVLDSMTASKTEAPVQEKKVSAPPVSVPVAKKQKVVPEPPLPIPTPEKLQEKEAVVVASDEGNKKSFPFHFLFGGVLLVGLVAAALFLSKRKFSKKKNQVIKVFHQIHWTCGESTSVEPSTLEEKEFWKEKAAQGVRRAWISPFEVAGELLAADDEYYALQFLERQIRSAHQAGIDLFPSLCFARTVFQYETFLMNPRLYLFKHVAPSDRHFSDEELRVKNIGFFPVWIPPFCQRQHALPERLLVAYGKLPGMMPSNDSVQFDLTAKELRQYAIHLFERLARVAPGVRIEGAAAMLNSSLIRYWRIHLNEQQKEKAHEFWIEVIAAVKAKFPHFMFIADAGGTDIALLLELGFDYVENSLLRETIVNQIRLESIGSLTLNLSGTNAALLDDSLYDLVPLFKSSSAKPSHATLASLLLSLLPGQVQHDGSGSESLNQFLKEIASQPLSSARNFTFLKSAPQSILAFARWDDQVAHIVVANFSTQSQQAYVRLDPFVGKFQQGKLYLFNDLLHGMSFRDLPVESSGEPALAVLAQDIRDNGLPVPLSALNLRLFSVNLTRPVHESTPTVRKLHKN